MQMQEDVCDVQGRYANMNHCCWSQPRFSLSFFNLNNYHIIIITVCVPTFRMKPSGQVSWSYHMVLYMSRRSRLVRKARVTRIRAVT